MKEDVPVSDGKHIAGKSRFLQNNARWLRARAAEGLTLMEIGERARCSEFTIRERLKHFGIERAAVKFDQRDEVAKETYGNKEWLEGKVIEEQLTDSEIGRLVGRSTAIIRKNRVRFGIPSVHERAKK